MSAARSRLTLKPADIVLTAGRGWLGRAIRFFERSPAESKARVNHAGIITRGGPVEEAEITEQLSRAVTHSFWNRYKGTKLIIYRMRGLSDASRLKVANKALSYIGRRYGYLKILLHVLDWGLSRLMERNVYCFRRFGRLDNYPICSWLDAYSYLAILYLFGMPPKEVQPDDIDRWCGSHQDPWEIIWPFGRLGESPTARDSGQATSGRGRDQGGGAQQDALRDAPSPRHKPAKTGIGSTKGSSHN